MVHTEPANLLAIIDRYKNDLEASQQREKILQSQLAELTLRVQQLEQASGTLDPAKLSNGTRTSLPPRNEDTSEMMETVVSTPKEAKPPPIHVGGVTDYVAFIAFLKTNGCTPCQHKVLRNGEIILYANTIADYRQLQSVIKAETVSKTNKTLFGEIGFHTYQLKGDKPFVAFLRSIPSCVDPEGIKTELLELGYAVQKVENVKIKIKSNNSLELRSLDLFRVELKPAETNNTIYNIKMLCNLKISVEPPKKKKTLPICKKCQRIGHTSTYCNRPPRCVHCSDYHPSAECTKQTEPPCCANCGDSHPANSRDCPKYVIKLRPVVQRRAIDRIRVQTALPQPPQTQPVISQNTSQSQPSAPPLGLAIPQDPRLQSTSKPPTVVSRDPRLQRPSYSQALHPMQSDPIITEQLCKIVESLSILPSILQRLQTLESQFTTPSENSYELQNKKRIRK